MSCSEIENRHNANPCYNLLVKKPIFRESSYTSQSEIKRRERKNERKKERKKERKNFYAVQKTKCKNATRINAIKKQDRSNIVQTI